MKEIINSLDKLLESRVRLGVMSLLSVNEMMDFNTLKDLMSLTDGNLASHISALEKEKYIKVKKGFIGKKTKTNYLLTEKGRKAFDEHLKVLEKLIKESK
ncbi:MAG: transcriptional regulator [Ignavibacteria bacterium]|nr:transcriptional regulator [Ignavibacteria bacterium]